MLILLLACAAPDDDGDVDPADSAAPDTADTGDTGEPSDTDDTGDSGDTGDTGDSGDTGDTGDCVFADVTVAGELVPGAVLTLSGSAEATWTVSAGTVSPTTGTTVEWTLPTDIAVNGPQTLTATATGCEGDATSEVDIEVDWPMADRVVVLYNPSVAGSEDVARHYAAARGIGDPALCGVAAADSTTLDGAVFDAYAANVQACIDAVGEHVWYLAPVYGVPYKVSGRVLDLAGTGSRATVSLDALLFYGALGASLSEAQYNPVYQEGDSPTYTYDDARTWGQVRRRLANPVYAVTRLDGADADAAMALVDRTLAAEAIATASGLDGIVYVDGRYGDVEPDPAAAFGSYEWGEWNMWGTRQVFEDFGAYEVVWDGNSAEFGTAPAPLTCPDALFYTGWYSYYNYYDVFTWAPGAVGGHLDSCSACDLRGGTWSAEALKRGITATFGAVNEPYVAGMPEYDQLFLYLTQGATFGEAAYESTVVGAWMMVFIGDPLYRPYP